MSGRKYREARKAARNLVGDVDALSNLIRNPPAGLRARHIIRGIVDNEEVQLPEVVRYRQMKARPAYYVRPKQGRGPEYYRNKQATIDKIEQELDAEE